MNISASPEVANGPWSGDPGEPGPFNGPAPTGTVALNAIATTKAFDFDADSSVGDYWFTSLIPAPGCRRRRSLSGSPRSGTTTGT